MPPQKYSKCGRSPLRTECQGFIHSSSEAAWAQNWSGSWWERRSISSKAAALPIFVLAARSALGMRSELALIIASSSPISLIESVVPAHGEIDLAQLRLLEC